MSTVAGTEAAADHRRADIQGIRAVAVTLVVLYHAGIGPPGGFIGVDVFFVVSGFVIGGLLLRELRGTGRLRLGAFYVRRARRLLPALALVSLVTLVAGALLLSPLGGRQQSLGQGVGAATAFGANLFFPVWVGGYFQPAAATHPFLHTWTLSVEEQFYLGFPFLLLLGAWLARRRRAPRWLPAVLGIAFALSLAAGIGLTIGLAPGALPALVNRLQPGFYSPVCRAWEFLAGALLTLVAWRPPRRVAAGLAWGGAALLAAGAATIHAGPAFPGALAAAPVLATAALLLAGRARTPARPTRALTTAPAVAIGDRSYSWYLWHWPAIVLAGAARPGLGWVAALAGLGSLLPAAWSYRYVERPIHYGQRLASKRATAALATACVLLPVAAASTLVAVADHGWYRGDIDRLAALTAPDHLDLPTGCATPEPLGSPARPACRWSVDRPRGTVLLVGDSNAGHLTEPFLAAARGLGFDAEVATTGGCPLLLRARGTDAACRRFVEGTVAAIAGRPTPYSAIIVSNASVGYLGGPLAAGFAADAPAPARGTPRERAVAGWAADVRHTLAAIDRGTPLVLVGAVPQFLGLPGCLRPSLLRGPTPECGRLAPADARAARADVVAAERAAVAGLGGRYLDTADRLCQPDGACSAFVAGSLVYRDGAHLSVSGSLLFEPDLEAALGGRPPEPGTAGGAATGRAPGR